MKLTIPYYLHKAGAGFPSPATDYIEEDIARYANVTKADVMRVFKKYIQNKHGVIMSIVPKGKLEMIAAEDNYTPKERKIPKP